MLRGGFSPPRPLLQGAGFPSASPTLHGGFGDGHRCARDPLTPGPSLIRMIGARGHLPAPMCPPQRVPWLMHVHTGTPRAADAQTCRPSVPTQACTTTVETTRCRAPGTQARTHTDARTNRLRHTPTHTGQPPAPPPRCAMWLVQTCAPLYTCPHPPPLVPRQTHPWPPHGPLHLSVGHTHTKPSHKQMHAGPKPPPISLVHAWVS